MVRNKTYQAAIEELNLWKALAEKLQDTIEKLNINNEQLLEDLKDVNNINEQLLKLKVSNIESYINKHDLIEQMIDSKYANPSSQFQTGVNAAIDYWVTQIKYMISIK